MVDFNQISDYEVSQILWNIYPRCHWHRDSNGNFVWDETEIPAPTQQQIDDTVAWMNESYYQPRWKSYPPVDNQIDAIYKGFKYLRDHGTDIGPDAEAWVDQIDAVKDQFPKE